MKRVRKIANEFAKDMKINSLPVEMEKLEEIAKSNGWEIIPYSKGYNFIKAENLERYCYTSKGFTYSSLDCTIIFIKDDLGYLDKINVICHEMGHLVLRHIAIGTNQKSNTANNEDKIQELEADAFSLELQVPTYLMQQLKITTTRSLVDNGILSRENAKKRGRYYISDIYANNNFFKISLITIVLIIVILVTFYITSSYYKANSENSLLKMHQTISSETTSETTETTSILAYDTTSGEMVYITKTGSKYHKQDCYYIKNSETIALTVEQAEQQGYSPCAVCIGY